MLEVGDGMCEYLSHVPRLAYLGLAQLEAAAWCRRVNLKSQLESFDVFHAVHTNHQQHYAALLL